MAVSADEFKQSLQRWASGVTVVTTKAEGKEEQGMTVTSFASVSLDPPQILVCLNDAAETGEGIQESGYFAVNILSSEQESVSNNFAGGNSMQERFNATPWSSGVTGAPVLDETLASLECKMINQMRAGTHWIVVGEVQNVICRSGNPLLYFRAGYQKLATI
jgi:flavin reductase (DIM6/NTAB) family NADH-FMN oxidoreductase RutF